MSVVFFRQKYSHFKPSYKDVSSNHVLADQLVYLSVKRSSNCWRKVNFRLLKGVLKPSMWNNEQPVWREVDLLCYFELKALKRIDVDPWELKCKYHVCSIKLATRKHWTPCRWYKKVGSLTLIQTQWWKRKVVCYKKNEKGLLPVTKERW